LSKYVTSPYETKHVQKRACVYKREHTKFHALQMPTCYRSMWPCTGSTISQLDADNNASATSKRASL